VFQIQKGPEVQEGPLFKFQNGTEVHVRVQTCPQDGSLSLTSGSVRTTARQTSPQVQDTPCPAMSGCPTTKQSHFLNHKTKAARSFE
jgi:hypothetical protein